MLILPLILLTDTLLFSPIATILFNCYKSNVPLFTDNNPLSSDEGTTQGAMAISLIKNLKEFTVQQVWYADDAATLGKHQLLRYWWNRLSSDGPLYGYFVNPSKSWLLVKPEFIDAANSIYKNTNNNFTSEGQKYLGSTIGSDKFSTSFFSKQYLNGYLS